MAHLFDAHPVIVQAIREDFEAGVLSLREIVKAHSTEACAFSHTTVASYARVNGWNRNLLRAIQSKAEQKTQVAIAREHYPDAVPMDTITERQVIEANAERIAQVRGEHRSDIARARNILLAQFAKMELISGGDDAIAKLRVVLAAASTPQELLNATKQLGAEEPILRGLMQSLRTVIELEREAYGIDKGEPEKPPSDDVAPDLTELARGVAFMLTRVAIARAKEGA